ncbi:YitT family protein [Christensenellaceae bacterium OttesenSCG-928-L17]|nr:YitT family protein [Christensenellaceae bacterium OttesenSCG-928-L17]
MSKNIRTILIDSLFILIGTSVTALGIAVFTIPNRIAPGGLSGLATAISYISHIPVGMLTLALNVPLLIIAWRRMGLRALFKTLVSTVLLSVFIDIFSAHLPHYTNNVLLAALTGGVVTGAGMGLLLLRGISTGGTDLIGLMVHKSRPTFSLGQLLMALDTLVVLIAVLVFRDLEVALYSVVTLMVASKTIDALQQGIDHAKVIYIITGEGERILQSLAGDMGRGVTVLPARGGFTGEEKMMLMTIARRSEVASTLQIVRTLDSAAFTILSDASAVYGEGFKGS